MSDALVTCQDCGGSGIIQSWFVEDCETCGGFGRIEQTAAPWFADVIEGLDK